MYTFYSSIPAFNVKFRRKIPDHLHEQVYQQGFKAIILTLLLVLFSQSGFSQYQFRLIPRISPDKKLSHTIGLTQIDVRYGSPSVKGRAVWGKLAEYDKVWRAGANEATTFSCEHDVRIEGQLLPKGTYALFIIPRQFQPWTVVFSQKSEQWGAFRYDEQDDALRIEVLPQSGPFQEFLSYSIEQHGYQFGRLMMRWENVVLPLSIETNYAQLFASMVEEKAYQTDENIQWIVYLQAAEHLLEINTDLPLALQWIQESEKKKGLIKAWNKQFYPLAYVEGHMYWTMAKIHAAQDSYEKALAAAEKLTGSDSPNPFFEKHQEEEEVEQLIKLWTKRVEKAKGKD
ncbi:MAG: DUF2911 domain-containing protein [Bacteroidota bacterium]